MQSDRRLVTKRLTLEATNAEHGEGLWNAVQASAKELALWMPWAIEPNRQETVAFALAAEKRWDAEAGWNFTILERDEVIGSVGLDNPDTVLETCNVGYWLRSDRTGRGLMTEAAASVVDYAFNVRSLHRLELRAAQSNVASARVAEKLGFLREGLLRDGSRGAEGWHDTYLYALLSSDPRPTRT